VSKKDDLKAKLETPLKEDTEYFDATAAIKAIEEELHLAKQRMVQLEKLFQLQSGINGQLLENMNALLLRVAEMDKPASSLILPERLTN